MHKQKKTVIRKTILYNSWWSRITYRIQVNYSKRQTRN